ncbi:MAG: hypothetical protein KAT29_15370 [Anaerolineales bacterium]|nr:hypothetical protein [Anaerolineales bacterium]
MTLEFISLSAILNIAAGALLLIYWYAFALFMPYKELSSTLALLVEHRNWVWINTIGVLGALLGLLGQAGILAVQINQASWVGVIGYFIASSGTVLLIGTMIWETVLWPIFVKHDRSLLDFNGPLYRSKTFVPFFVIAGLIYSVGYILVGVGIMQTDILPWMGGLLLAVGAPTFGLGSMFGKYQVYPRSIGVTLMSAGLIWLGIAMFGVS